MAFLLLILSVACKGPTSCPDCNVLWITVDTLRQDRVGCYGNTKGLTPSIDWLASKGTRFEHAVAPGPATIYSVPVYLTGTLRPNLGMNFELNARTGYTALADEVTTLPEVLKGRGWRTWAHNANKLISGQGVSDFNLAQGLENWDLVTDAEVEQKGIAKLAELSQQHFFLYLHFLGPHAPNPELEGFEQRRGHFDSVYRKPTGLDQPDYDRLRVHNAELTPDDVGYARALYDDAVWEADGRVGRVLSALHDLKLDSKTIVVFVSDHGENLGDPEGANTWGHGGNLSQKLLSVPLILKGPAVPKGYVDHTQVMSLVDLAPTVLSLVGIPVDPAWKWDGQARLGVGTTSGTVALSERNTPRGRQGSAQDNVQQVQVFEWAKNASKVFDLSGDPDETHPTSPAQVAPERQAAVQSMEALRWSTWQNAHPPAVKTFDPSSSDVEQLKAIGYVE